MPGLCIAKTVLAKKTNMYKSPIDFYSPLHQKLIDGLISGISFYLAYQTLFEGHVPAPAAAQMWMLLPPVMVARVSLNVALRSYRTIWKYVSLRDAIVLARTYTLFSAVLVALRYSLPRTIFRIPLGIIVTELLLSFLGAAAARVARRLLYERIAAHALTNQNDTPVRSEPGGQG